MALINDIFTEVIKEIIPTENELAIINSIVEKITSLLDKRAKEINVKYTIIEPQGSTGIKQTQLRSDFDIDLFVGLPYEEYKPNYKGLSKNKMKKESKKDFLGLCNEWIIKSLVLKEFQNPQLLYAEHPYVTVDYILRDIKIKMDIVLYFDLEREYISKNGPITAVDRSPWHGRFVRDELSQEQKNEVRLLKQFFKACHSYGDKSAVGKVGFIGYSAELLIHHFGTIQKVFENFDGLKQTPIDYFKRSIKDLNKIIHFQNDYLIITDPIDMNRNVASAISEQAYKYCNQRVKDFLSNPTKDFFVIKPIPKFDLTERIIPQLYNIYIAEFKNKDDKRHYTISRDKLYSLGDTIIANGEKEYSHSERFGKILFEVYFEDNINEFNLVLYCKNPVISPTFMRKGPPIHDKSHAGNFKSKNPNYFERDGHFWVETPRIYTDFLPFLKDFIIQKVPENLEIINISKFVNVKTSSGKKAINVLLNMVLPFYL